MAICFLVVWFSLHSMGTQSGKSVAPDSRDHGAALCGPVKAQLTQSSSPVSESGLRKGRVSALS